MQLLIDYCQKKRIFYLDNDIFKNWSQCARRQNIFLDRWVLTSFSQVCTLWYLVWEKCWFIIVHPAQTQEARFFSSKIFIVRLSSMDAMLECEFYTKGNISLCRRSPYDTTPPPCELYLFSAEAIAGRRAHIDLLWRIWYRK